VTITCFAVIHHRKLIVIEACVEKHHDRELMTPKTLVRVDLKADGHPALIEMNSCNDFGHDDSTMNIVVVIIIIIIIIMFAFCTETVTPIVYNMPVI